MSDPIPSGNVVTLPIFGLLSDSAGRPVAAVLPYAVRSRGGQEAMMSVPITVSLLHVRWMCACASYAPRDRDTTYTVTAVAMGLEGVFGDWKSKVSSYHAYCIADDKWNQT